MADYFSTQPFVPVPSHARSGGAEGTEQPSLGQTTPVGTPTEDSRYAAEGAAIQVSNTFNFNAALDPLIPDTIIVTPDEIFFAVHAHRLLAASGNFFGGLLSAPAGAEPLSPDTPRTLVVPEPSNVFNVALHCVYGLSVDIYGPTFECLESALQTMQKYGLAPLERFVSRGMPLYNTILNHGPVRPLETYALAGANMLTDLAIAASAYTLPVSLRPMPEALAVKMGVLYLHRLYGLHSSRMDALKEMLDETIFPHVARPYCSVEKRQVVNRAYSLAAAQVFYNATPALSRGAIESIMNGLADAVSCPDCKLSLGRHVNELVTKWMLLGRTI